LRHKDVFRHLVLPKLGPKSEYWDNLSSENEIVQESFKECEVFCKSKADCLQFAFRSQTCKISTTVKLGHPMHGEEKDEVTVTSGWLMDRVATFIDDLDSRCHDEDWVSFK
jgi:hypothetical protein